MASHLPPDDLIAEYAFGASSPGVSLLMAAHMTHAPETRARVDQFEELGGIMLASGDEMEMPEGAIDMALATIEDTASGADGASRTDTAAAKPGDASPIPGVVLERAGMAFEDIPWRFVLPGLSGYEFEGFDDEHVSLLKARPGAKVPRHTHHGIEMTLVLQGCLSDGGVDYRKGDVAINDEHDAHRPEIRGDETCLCLIVRRGGLHFTGRLSRFLNYLGY